MPASGRGGCLPLAGAGAAGRRRVVRAQGAVRVT